ncbi:hypothetical protein PHSY_003906 [Pseudozyma hubeiensis SY62]|uniref:Uncharacterized protein n=1 Tax=Pseudozyma hubeiensis (strain SY62) TaxID=1305764 RepID=R9P4S1_PSEHS|nr:hypothetical protein PHSY_003906 [Pseudozyma hubeiensis SY62]GAC96326.1 hypothetical protein PHSY_003906 [Pseudozyma hubeiensis SY62]
MRTIRVERVEKQQEEAGRAARQLCRLCCPSNSRTALEQREKSSRQSVDAQKEAARTAERVFWRNQHKD